MQNWNFTFFTETIMHLFYPPPPKKKKFGLTIVFDFSCEDCNTQKKLEIMAMYKIFFFGGEGLGKVGTYGLGGKREFQSHEVFSRPVIWFPSKAWSKFSHTHWGNVFLRWDSQFPSLHNCTYHFIRTISLVSGWKSRSSRHQSNMVYKHERMNK